MFDELSKYTNNGHFFFSKGKQLIEASKEVPEAPGVYYIIRLARGNVDLVYIGKSGTILQNGNLKDQLLRERINNKQGDVKCQEYFDQKMQEEDIDALDIYWFVTYDKNHHDLPDYVEGILMQRYIEIYGSLPPWNKDF